MEKTRENFDKYLDRLYEDRGNPFEDLGITGSKVIKGLDPTLYEVGFSEWEAETEEETKEVCHG